MLSIHTSTEGVRSNKSIGLRKQIKPACQAKIRKEMEMEDKLQFNPNYLNFQEGVKAGKAIGIQKGRREVVEFVKAHSEIERCDPQVMPYFEPYVELDLFQWQDQLKEWGIE
ncbi:MAG: hypothetical protein Q8K68_13155 [Nitrospirota bacterium]|nr:hypothetical protein [Nitrospirota bacterium]